MEKSTTFAVTTLGCKVNQADSEAISDQMSAAGFIQRDFQDEADVYIVNTCTVTHLGDRSSRQLIAQAHRRRPDALLVVTGCYAELNPQAVSALPGVKMVIGNREKDSLLSRINEHLSQEDQNQDQIPLPAEPPSPPRRVLPLLSSDIQHVGSDQALLPDEEPVPDNPIAHSSLQLPEKESAQNRIFARTRVQMKVQDGCDNRCTYCIVPTVRGNSRSRSIASVVENVQRKARAGYQEVVLTGIHLGDYHPEEEQKSDLGDLIAALLRETEIPRIRVSSLEPEDFQLEWLELWQDPRMCRHFHLPMQSGSDAILRRMARRYLSERYATIVKTAQQRIPGVAITTDIITGFPGETDEDFEQTYQLAAELQFAKMHVFRFSPRQGTAAARMRGHIREEIKKERSARLLSLNESMGRQFREQFLGQTIDVLVEQAKHGQWEGLTDNYLRIQLHNPGEETHNMLQQHTIIKTRLLHLLDDDSIMGTIED